MDEGGQGQPPPPHYLHPRQACSLGRDASHHLLKVSIIFIGGGK